MIQARGEKNWIIPDGYIPPHSSGILESHESICVLNCSTERAQIMLTIYFEDCDPLENIIVEIEGRRTKHIRTASLQKNGEKIPVGIPYAIELKSNIPIFVQYSRLDATQSENALMSVMAIPINTTE